MQHLQVQPAALVRSDTASGAAVSMRYFFNGRHEKVTAETRAVSNMESDKVDVERIQVQLDLFGWNIEGTKNSLGKKDGPKKRGKMI